MENHAIFVFLVLIISLLYIDMFNLNTFTVRKNYHTKNLLISLLIIIFKFRKNNIYVS